MIKCAHQGALVRGVSLTQSHLQNHTLHFTLDLQWLK